jgi:TnpA family transposase
MPQQSFDHRRHLRRRTRFELGVDADACASDSKKFGSWESNLMTQYHQRYGGPRVMIYWHVFPQRAV